MCIRDSESAVLTLVSDTLRAIAEYSRNDRTEFIHTVQETQVAQQLSLIHIFKLLDDWKGQQKEHEKPEKKIEQEK